MGEMSDQERKAFEQLMSTDAELRSEVELQQIANNVVLTSRVVDLKKEIGLYAKSKKVRRQTKRLLMIGAGTIVISLSVLFWPKNDQPVPVDSPKISKENIIDNPTQQANQKSVDIEEPIKETKNTSKQNNPIRNTRKSEQSTDQNLTLHPSIQTQENISIQETEEVIEDIQSLADENPIELVDKTDTEPIDICAGKQIKLSGTATKTCINKSDAIIKLSTQGGKAPYTFKLKGSEIIYSENQIKNLSAGEYWIDAYDANNCKTSSPVLFEVVEESCYEPAKSFSPAYEEWEYKSDLGNVKIIIRDKAGNIQFESEGESIKWNGVGKNGSPANADTYIYLIYKNGKLIDKDYLTIIP